MDVIEFLTGVLGHEKSYHKSFDIAGTEILTYQQMLLQFAAERGLKRYIWTVPVLTPRLSSYWLYFITSTSFQLASSLVDSMKVEVIAKETKIQEIVPVKTLSYRECIKSAFDKFEILGSYTKGAVLDFPRSHVQKNMRVIQVPVYGCYKDVQVKEVQNPNLCIQKIWKIGGSTGWYHANWLWELRGFLDKLIGGVGLNRRRTHNDTLEEGDTLDFWRVLYANKEEKRLILFAEMKLPGEAWLEFRITKTTLTQTATFRPRGWAGRLYWYSVLPLHGYLFKGMIAKLANSSEAS